MSLLITWSCEIWLQFQPGAQLGVIQVISFSWNSILKQFENVRLDCYIRLQWSAQINTAHANNIALNFRNHFKRNLQTAGYYNHLLLTSIQTAYCNLFDSSNWKKADQQTIIINIVIQHLSAVGWKSHYLWRTAIYCCACHT